MSDDLNNPNRYIKIPNTPIVDTHGYMAREWVYFFNDIGKAVDASIQANLSEMTNTLLASADNASLSLQALPVVGLAGNLAGQGEVLPSVTMPTPSPLDVSDVSDVALPDMNLLKKIEELHQWQLLTNS